MSARVFRALLGFVLACLAAGLTLVLFVDTPAELARLSGDALAARLGEVGLLTLAAATRAAVFSAPFAFLGVLAGEWRGVAGRGYYMLAGLVVALLGIGTEHWTEAVGELSVLGGYAISAFLLAGLVGGFVFGLIAGRRTVARDRSRSAAEAQPHRSDPVTAQPKA